MGASVARALQIPHVGAAEARDAPRRSSRDERRLVRAVQAGSEEALEALFRTHWPRAHRAAYLIVHDAVEAEDIAQEAFLSALRSLDRFDRRRPFGPWLHRIVVNRAIDHTRARAARREVLGDSGPEPAAPGGQGAPQRVAPALLTALGTLGPEHRAVVVLRYLLDMTPGEIASLLELPRGTVNSRLRRALDALEGLIGDGERE
jgi:RNA polymerase sigma-70 factor (ECF subfamily)